MEINNHATAKYVLKTVNFSSLIWLFSTSATFYSPHAKYCTGIPALSALHSYQQQLSSSSTEHLCNRDLLTETLSKSDNFRDIKPEMLTNFTWKGLYLLWQSRESVCYWQIAVCKLLKMIYPKFDTVQYAYSSLLKNIGWKQNSCREERRKWEQKQKGGKGERTDRLRKTASANLQCGRWREMKRCTVGVWG